jgi:cephalosporin hydroxylase
LRSAVERVAGRAVVVGFHGLYYHHPERTVYNTTWLGVQVGKIPLDLWVYQEILFERRPDYVIETGTANGGSALWFASMCDLIGHGEVISIDNTAREGLPQHPRITYVTGSSTSADVVAELPRGKETFVDLDSDHRKEHVLQELELYSELVRPGGYLVVEDTILNGHPVNRSYGPGPYEAVDEFLAAHPNWERDLSREKFYATFNPGGYLRRVS